MGYNKNKFVRKLEIPVNFLEIQDEDPAVFHIRYRKFHDIEQYNEWMMGLTAEQREDPELALEFIIETICMLLLKEPDGFDDFPIDDRPLYERAVEYFLDNEPDEQEMYNTMLYEIYKAHQEALKKDIFQMLQVHNPPNLEARSGEAEDQSGL